MAGETWKKGFLAALTLMTKEGPATVTSPSA